MPLFTSCRVGVCPETQGLQGAKRGLGPVTPRPLRTSLVVAEPEVADEVYLLRNEVDDRVMMEIQRAVCADSAP